jgi:ATP-dependent DNA helicase PIF1
MQHWYCVEAFDCTCQDIGRFPNKPFGGITMVFGGDFHQTLPVIPQGQPGEIIAACLKRSPLWSTMQKLHLTQNMQLQGDPDMARFAQWLLEVGEGRGILQGTSGSIPFPPTMLVRSQDELINKVYTQLDVPGHANDEYLRGQTILTPRNDDVVILNKKILAMFPGDVKTYHSADKATAEHGIDGVVNSTKALDFIPIFLDFFRRLYAPVLDHVTPALRLAELPL